MIAQLVLPILALAIVTVLITRGIEFLMPESLPGIAATGLIATLLTWLAASAGFAALYALQDPRVLSLIGQVPQAGIGHFLKLGASAGMIWAPILLLVVITAPRRWKTATW
ncbi:hypothetical protein [Antarctobacter jejuensis]|uniref:hypothetical protein n=1 Tax=Antarctobacter jejuensis TaxID=1439938 RepID=UPI003FD4B6CD